MRCLIHLWLAWKLHPTTLLLISIFSYEFKINSQGKEYCMLPYTRLEGCLEIVKTDGTPYAGNADDFSVCNMFPNSIFKQVECQVNGYVNFQ